MGVEDEDPATARFIQAIRDGDLATVRQVLDERPALASAPLSNAGGRTPLHVATDWPGYFPNGPDIVRTLLAAGADPNRRTEGEEGETPLHWAASSDDLEVADALIAGGADLEAPRGSIGTPLDNAIGYGCWHVAYRLVERGARIDKLWQAAALGRTELVEAMLHDDPAPTPTEINSAFWQACSGGQLRVAALLHRHGADPHATPEYARGTAADVAAGPGTRRGQLLAWLAGLDVVPTPGA